MEASKPDTRRDIVLCMSQLNLSARAYHRILKLARTVADLAMCNEIQSSHLAERAAISSEVAVALNTNLKLYGNKIKDLQSKFSVWIKDPHRADNQFVL